MGELIAVGVAIVVYLVFAKYINYVITLITYVFPSQILVFILMAIAVSVIFFIIGRRKD